MFLKHKKKILYFKMLYFWKHYGNVSFKCSLNIQNIQF